MTVTFAALADHASKTDTGKLNILGMFTQLESKETPYFLSHAALVVQVTVSPEEAGRIYAARMVVINPNGEDIYPADFSMSLPSAIGPSGAVDLILEFGGLSFNLPGKYEVVLFLDGSKVVATPFEVVQG